MPTPFPPGIIPFRTPSETSFIIGVIIPEELGIPMSWAYWDIAAIVIP